MYFQNDQTDAALYLQEIGVSAEPCGALTRCLRAVLLSTLHPKGSVPPFLWEYASESAFSDFEALWEKVKDPHIQNVGLVFESENVPAFMARPGELLGRRIDTDLYIVPLPRLDWLFIATHETQFGPYMLEF